MLSKVNHTFYVSAIDVYIATQNRDFVWMHSKSAVNGRFF